MSEVENQIVKSEHYNQSKLMEDAQQWISSGILPAAIQKPEQAVVIVLKGRELGLDPMQSFDFIDVIMGKSALKPKGMGALVRKGGVSYTTVKDFEAIKDEAGNIVDYETAIKFIRWHKNPDNSFEKLEDVVGYKWSEAVAMGLTNKDNWKKQPGVMLYWRAFSKGANRVCPDLISGMYTTEEVASFTPNAPTVMITEDGVAEIVG